MAEKLLKLAEESHKYLTDKKLLEFE